MPIETTTAFAVFYERTVVDLTAFVRRRAHFVLVEDLIAETYTIAWRRRRDIPAGDETWSSPSAGGSARTHDPARAWLFGVARNQLMSASRGRRQRSELEIRLAPEAVLTAPDPATGVSDRDTFRTAWATLAPLEQEVLSLHLLDDLDGAAAARVLECSRAAYSMRLSR